jgi:hypothetical protein
VNATTTQQHDIKSLAQAVLARNRRNSERNNSASTELRTPATGAKNSLRIAAAEQLHGIRIAELRELAGKDWPELEANPELLECFADMVAVRHMRERGEVPPSYTAVTVCAGCGPVPIFPGVAEKVEGCPWCLNRAAGRPVPRVGVKNAT